MAANTISPVPNNMPIADKQGNVSQIWSGFFNQLWTRAGGASASSNSSLQDQIDAFSQSAANTIKGNNTGAPASALDLTPAEVAAMLPAFTSALKGSVPASGGGVSKFLRADGNWASPITAVFDFSTSSRVNTLSSAVTSASFATASNSPSFTVVPNFTGTYKVYASIPVAADGTNSAMAAARIIKTSGTATLLAESQAFVSGKTSGALAQSSIYAQSTYALVSGSTCVFDFQIAILAGTSVKVDGSNSPFYMFAERVG